MLNIVQAGPGQVKIFWDSSATGFVLQERASLSAGDWVNSPSGSANPAVVSATSGGFYRLSKTGPSALARPAVEDSASTQFRIRTRVFLPAKSDL